MNSLMREALNDHGLRNETVPADRVLIPVHTNRSAAPGFKQDFPETKGPEGNLRFWVIDQDLLWSGLDGRVDE
jgi:hypothetical protein